MEMTMRSLFFRFLILPAAIVLWIAFLALGIRPDYSKWSNFKLLTLHFLPPVGICLAWWVGRWRLSRRNNDAPDAQQSQAQVAATTGQETAQAQFEQRRQYCDCRLLAISDLATYEMMELPDSSNASIAMVAVDQKEEELASEGMPRAFDSGIAEALGYLYAECGAAAALPIYLVPPADIAANDAIERVQRIAARLLADLKLAVKLRADAPLVMIMPSRGNASNSVLGLFESIPEMPAAVVLAFDSQIAQMSRSVAKPGHGVFALLVTAANLPAMLEAVANIDEQSSGLGFSRSPIQPDQSNSNLTPLTRVSKPLRDELGAHAPVARIYRAATGRIDENPGRSQAVEHALAALLEQALPSVGRSLAPAINGTELQPADDIRCEWLVHNTGESKHAGSRLAAIASALMHRKIELKPVEMATDMVRHVGDLGKASSIGMLAVALIQAQSKKAPVLCAEFSGTDGVALAFAEPVQKNQ